MAKLSQADILRLAKLARLELSDVEVESLQAEVGAVIGYVEQLHKVQLDGIKPTYQVTGLENVMRSDEVVDYGVSSDELLKNAPKIENKLIKVRRVL
jgi:aspartyl-tRNA(Asn)/glutamyl-tRNA(Gln) amidotransferase subunit C